MDKWVLLTYSLSRPPENSLDFLWVRKRNFSDFCCKFVNFHRVKWGRCASITPEREKETAMRLTIILVGPARAENVGVAAVAMKTMGFRELRIVDSEAHRAAGTLGGAWLRRHPRWYHHLSHPCRGAA